MKISMSVKALVLVAGFAAVMWLAPTVAQAAVTWTGSVTDGFGDVNNLRVMSFAQYGGKLYAGTYNFATGGEVWAYDGTTWTQTNTDGFGSNANLEITSLTVYNNALYAATVNIPTGTEIWKYDGTTWTQSNTDGFGDAHNYVILTMAAYGGKLYAGTYNFSSGTEVWAYDGTTWTQSNTDGFGNTGNWYTDSLVTYQGNLLAGVANTGTGGQLWQYNGTTWTAINSDGFGDTANLEPYSMYVDGSTLYLGTWNEINGGEVWTYNGSAFTRIGTSGLGDANNKTIVSINKYHGAITAGTRNLVTGGEVWTYDGSTWTQSNTDGFGSADNTRAYSLTIFGRHVFTGTYNTVTGAQIWMGTVPETTLGMVTVPATNGRPNVKVFDATGAQLSSFFAYTATRKMNLKSIQADIDGDGAKEIVTAPSSGAEARIKVFESNGTTLTSTLAYSASFTGGVSLTAGDFNNDGRDEIAVVPLTGGRSNVRVYALNGAGTGLTLVDTFLAYSATYRGGANLAAGDVVGRDGIDELIVGPYGSGRPNLRVYHLDATTGKFSLVDWTMAYSDTFRGGVQVATGDINNDYQDDIIVVPQSNGRANVRVYTISTSSKLTLLTSVLAYSGTYRGTVSLDTGDLDGNGTVEIVLAPRTAAGPRVRTFSYQSGRLVQTGNWLAYSGTFHGGVSLLVSDVDGDGKAEVSTAPAARARSTVKVYNLDTGSPVLATSFLAYSGSYLGGVNFGK